MLRLDITNKEDREFLEKKGVNIKAILNEINAQALLDMARVTKKRTDAQEIETKSTSKFGNKITEYDGVKFASKYELEVWLELLILERTGKISNLKRQITCKFEHNNVKLWTTRPDYYFEVEVENGRKVPIYADAKNPFTEKGRTFKASQAMFRAFYGYPMVVFKKGDDIEKKISEHLVDLV